MGTRSLITKVRQDTSQYPSLITPGLICFLPPPRYSAIFQNRHFPYHEEVSSLCVCEGLLQTLQSLVIPQQTLLPPPPPTYSPYLSVQYTFLFEHSTSKRQILHTSNHILIANIIKVSDPSNEQQQLEGPGWVGNVVQFLLPFFPGGQNE